MVADVIIGVIVGVVGAISVGIGGEFMVRRGVGYSGRYVGTIIFGNVDNGIGIVFGEWVASVNGWHVFFKSNGFDARYDGIGYGEYSPRAAMDTVTSGEGHKVVITTRITGGIGGNGTEGARFSIVGCAIIDLDVGSKFKGKCAIIGFGGSCNNGCRG